MKQNNYLGTEKVGVLLKQFAIPCIFSLIISCLYNIVDQIFVGNGVGYLGNAATGVIFPITVIGWGLSLFFGESESIHRFSYLSSKYKAGIDDTGGAAALADNRVDAHACNRSLSIFPFMARPSSRQAILSIIPSG